MASKILLYNPDQKSKEEIIQEFVIRNQELDSIWNTLKTSNLNHPPQHILVQGQRGMGKTTLLLRLKYAIEDDPELSEWLLPIKFSEEQYHMSSLGDLWESIADYLETHFNEFENINANIAQHERESDFEEKAANILIKALNNKKKRVLVMIDNLGDLFQKFSELETHRLRQILLTHSEIQLLGASSYVLEHNFTYDKAFYEFFQTVNLKPITKEQSLDLLRILGKRFAKETEVENLIKAQMGKMEVLRRFTGGVPRTMALLFGLFMDHQSGTTFETLQLLLDEVNSLYKHRMDELKPQQQKIMDTLAKAWEPITSKQLLEQSKLYRQDLKSNQISAQLKLMEDNQLIESLSGQGKIKSYRIRERFFNIWYLMRYGKKFHKDEVLWLVKFLEMWCDTDELKQQIGYQIDALKTSGFSPKAAYLKSLALYHTSGDPEDKLVLMESTESFLIKKNELKAAEQIGKQKEKVLNSLVMKLREQLLAKERLRIEGPVSELDISSLRFIIKDLINHCGYKRQDPYRLQLLTPILEIGHSKSIDQASIWLGYALENVDPLRSIQIWKSLDENENSIGTTALAHYYVRRNQLKRAEYYFIKATNDNEPSSFINLGWFSQIVLKNYEQAKSAYEKAIELDSNEALFNLGFLYELGFKNPEQARIWYEKAIKKGNEYAAIQLGGLYENVFGNLNMAEDLYLQGVELGNTSAMTQLATLYWLKMDDSEKAEKYFLNAKDLDGSSAYLCLMGFYAGRLNLRRVLEVAEEAFSDKEYVNNPIQIDALIRNMFASQQYHFLFNQFKKPELELMKYARPYWYVLMWFMKDEFPGEYEKVGSELKETVDEIIQSIVTSSLENSAAGVGQVQE